ncbi:hypothetical protein V7083_12585 [Bacillus sp. JJ1764]
MYKAILVLFFVVVCLTAFIFSSLRDSFYTFL